MKILAFSGSSRPTSSNVKFLKSLSHLSGNHEYIYSDLLFELPLFRAELDGNPSDRVQEWRKLVGSSDAVMISTPEYIHNFPAALKNALEWLTSSGEMDKMPVIAITLTPHEPRGEKAMESLLWTLTALNCSIKGQVALYNNELKYNDDGRIIGEYQEIMNTSIEMLVS